MKMKNNVALLILLFSLVFFITPDTGAQKCGPCGECPNPLVQLMTESQITGLHSGGQEGALLGSILRGIKYIEFREKHPCADIYYIIYPEYGDKAPTRVGAKQGAAKYEIRTKIDIFREGGEALVIHGTPSGNQPALVPRTGTVHVEFQLFALKNEQIYDFGLSVFDWVPDPPEGESYFRADGPIKIDGTEYDPEDGLIFGELDAPSLSGFDPDFFKGDIGMTIRKKETPSSVSLEIDDESLYGTLYKLKINNIRNYFNESLPDNVEIALKAEEGEILGKREIDGWKIFKTKAGKIPHDVFYQPPDCTKSKKDILKIAGICDFHDGRPSVCSQYKTYDIPLVTCPGVMAIINCRFEKVFNYEDVEFGRTRSQDGNIKKEVTVFVDFGNEPKLKGIDPMRNVAIYHYQSHSASISSSFGFKEGNSKDLSNHHKNYAEYNADATMELKPGGTCYLFLTIDRETNKITRVGGLYPPKINITWTGTTKIEKKDWVDGYWVTEKIEYEIDENIDFMYDFTIDWKKCVESFQGDGEKFITGQCHEKIEPRGKITGYTQLNMKWQLFLK